MTITGAGSITATTLAAQNNLFSQLEQLSQQLGTGQASQTYAGLGSQAGVAVSLSAQLSAINSYATTGTALGTTLTLSQSVLTQIGSSSTAVQQAISQQGQFSLDNTGQTATQKTAASYLDQIVSLLNTQAGNGYIFSGSATDQQSVAATGVILNGSGSQAGLVQVISQRQQADEGTNGLGRLTVGGSGSTVTLASDGSPFGFQLSGVSSGLTGATATGPAGIPPTISVALGSNPNPGDSVAFNLTMPDGTSQTVTLTATTASPPAAGQFTIGSSAAQTASSLQSALTGSLTTLAQTALPASSAIAAANNFFSSDPPLRVNGPPYDTATSLVNGTSANTVFWYTGENGSTPALQTATAQVGPSMSVSYGMRANEPAIASLMANVGVLAATTYSSSNTNAAASYKALCQSVQANLAGQPGTQQVSDIEASLANAQTSLKNATTLNTQTQTTLQDMLQGIEGVNQTQIGELILTLQNNLSASMSVTARLAQMSLVNYLAPSSG